MIIPMFISNSLYHGSDAGLVVFCCIGCCRYTVSVRMIRAVSTRTVLLVRHRVTVRVTVSPFSDRISVTVSALSIVSMCIDPRLEVSEVAVKFSTGT